MYVHMYVCVYVCMCDFYVNLQGEQLLAAAKIGDATAVELLLKNTFIVNYKDLVRQNTIAEMLTADNIFSYLTLTDSIASPFSLPVTLPIAVRKYSSSLGRREGSQGHLLPSSRQGR